MSDALPVVSMTVVGGDSTDELLVRAQEIGAYLAKLIQENRDTYLQEFRIKDHKTGVVKVTYHPKLGILQLIAERFGFFMSVRNESLDDIRDADGSWVGYRVYAELVDRDGVFRGGGQIGICTRDEPGREFKTRSDILGMAETRALSRCARAAFGWVLEMAKVPGLALSATPASEMEAVEHEEDVPFVTDSAKPRRASRGLAGAVRPSSRDASREEAFQDPPVPPADTAPSKSEWRVRCQNGERMLREHGFGPADFEAWRVERFGKEFITTLVGAPSDGLEQYHKFLVTHYNLTVRAGGTAASEAAPEPPALTMKSE